MVVIAITVSATQYRDQNTVEPGTFIIGTTLPTSANTGIQSAAALTPVSGDITVTDTWITNSNGGSRTISGLKVTGRIIIQTHDVVVTNCEIIGAGYTGGNTALIDCNNSGCVNATISYNLLYQDVSTANLWHNAVIGHDYTATRNECYNVVDGFGVYNTGNSNGSANVTIQGNYVHDLAYFTPDPNHGDNHTHNDGVQIQGNSGIMIKGNNLSVNVSTTVGQSGSDSYAPAVTGQCITGSPNIGQITGVTIDSNWIDYGSRGMVFILGSFAAGVIGTCTNNRIGSNLHSTTGIQIDVTGGLSFSTYSGNIKTSDSSTVALSNGTG